MASPIAPRRIYLLTVPRCGSNLLQRILSTQPGLKHSSYHLFQAWLTSGIEKIYNEKGALDKLSAEERAALDEKFQKGYERMLDALQEAETAGQRALVKEHVIMLLDPLNVFRVRYPDDTGPPMVVHDPSSTGDKESAAAETRTSQTVLPDALLLSFQPVFQTRHPMLAFSSAIRALRDTDQSTPQADGMFEEVLQSYVWSRNLYEWYTAKGATPLVIDADDVMNEESGALRRLCDMTNLDADKLLLKWETRDEGTGIEKRFLSTINDSTGIRKGFSSEKLTLAEEEEKWKTEFGDKLAGDLSRRVRAAMDDYEWLKARKL